MQRWLPLILLAAGGAAGTLARVGLTTLVGRLHGSPWPLGTLVVNSCGCLLFGTVWGLLQLRAQQGPVSPLWSLALLGGFCGAFTTFSTFAFDAVRLAGREGAVGLVGPGGLAGPGAIGGAAGYVLLSNAAGLVLVWVGFMLAARLGGGAGAGG